MATPQHMEFPGQGSDPSHNCNLWGSCSDTRSLTHYAGQGIEPASQRSRDAANPVAPQQKLQDQNLFKSKCWLERVQRKKEPSYPVGGNINWCQTVENSMEVPQKPKNRGTIWSCNPTPGHTDKMKTLIWKDTCTPMFTATLLTITKTWKQPKWPSTEDWLKKMRWCTYIYSGILASHSENNAIMPFAATQMEIALSH